MHIQSGMRKDEQRAVPRAGGRLRGGATSSLSGTTSSLAPSGGSAVLLAGPRGARRDSRAGRCVRPLRSRRLSHPRRQGPRAARRATSLLLFGSPPSQRYTHAATPPAHLPVLPPLEVLIPPCLGLGGARFGLLRISSGRSLALARLRPLLARRLRRLRRLRRRPAVLGARSRRLAPLLAHDHVHVRRLRPVRLHSVAALHLDVRRRVVRGLRLGAQRAARGRAALQRHRGSRRAINPRGRSNTLRMPERSRVAGAAGGAGAAGQMRSDQKESRESCRSSQNRGSKNFPPAPLPAYVTPRSYLGVCCTKSKSTSHASGVAASNPNIALKQRPKSKSKNRHPILGKRAMCVRARQSLQRARPRRAPPRHAPASRSASRSGLRGGRGRAWAHRAPRAAGARPREVRALCLHAAPPVT